MKRTIVLVVAMLFAITMSAQVKYHPELNLSPGYFFGDDVRVHVSTIQGIKIGNYFSVGAGLGFQYDIHAGGSASDIAMNFAFPVFLNAKGYLPFDEKKALFASASVGYSYGLPSSTVFIQPGIGARFHKFKVELDYCYENNYYYKPGHSNNGIMLVLGWMFK